MSTIQELGVFLDHVVTAAADGRTGPPTPGTQNGIA
jgi:hypothetical protein